MMAGLYAAFWLQLESASSAAITVGILVLQTRGQDYQKAVYRGHPHSHRARSDARAYLDSILV
jgi:hypothetical protein